MVDPAYAMLSRAMFSTVDEIGLRDSKHGERVKMENYLAFADVLSHHAEENTILDYFVRDAKDRGNDAIEVRSYYCKGPSRMGCEAISQNIFPRIYIAINKLDSESHPIFFN